LSWPLASHEPRAEPTAGSAGQWWGAQKDNADAIGAKVRVKATIHADQILKVTEPPRLSIGSNGTTAMLSWPARAQGYGLFSAEQPDGPLGPVERRVVISGHQATVEVSIGGSVQFYRLQLP
jgi:hypothetical protein